MDGIVRAAKAALEAQGEVLTRKPATPPTPAPPPPPATPTDSTRVAQRGGATPQLSLHEVSHNPTVALRELSPQASYAGEMAVVAVNTSTALARELAAMSTPPTNEQRERLMALVSSSEYGAELAMRRYTTTEQQGTQPAEGRFEMGRSAERFSQLHQQMLELVRKQVRDQALNTPQGKQQLIAALELVPLQVHQETFRLPEAERIALRQSIHHEVAHLRQTPPDVQDLLRP